MYSWALGLECGTSCKRYPGLSEAILPDGLEMLGSSYLVTIKHPRHRTIHICIETKYSEDAMGRSTGHRSDEDVDNV